MLGDPMINLVIDVDLADELTDIEDVGCGFFCSLSEIFQALCDQAAGFLRVSLFVLIIIRRPDFGRDGRYTFAVWDLGHELR